MTSDSPRTFAARGVVRDNLARVREAIGAACLAAGRDPAEVRLVGVTKTVSARLAGMLVEAGCVDLGEGRPQGLWEKAASLPQARFHLVGPLQRNKVRRTLPLLTLLHSLDSLRLLEAIRAEAVATGRPCETLLEVNLDGDPGRGGVAPEAIAGLLAAAAATEGTVRVRGLMGMASVPGPDSPPGLARRQFARLRTLRDRHAADHPELVELSMGMSGDFPDAILEGATIVRVGSALWEGLEEEPEAPAG